MTASAPSAPCTCQVNQRSRLLLREPAIEPMQIALSGATLSRPRIPVVSNVDAQAHDDPEKINELLISQIVSPVRWEDSMRELLGMGVSQFYEVGPGRVLRGLLRRIERKIPCETVLD